MKVVKEAFSIEKPKTKEKEPRISYHVFYGSHRTAKDLEKFDEAFEKADVYIPELFGWNNKDLWIFNKVSQGKLCFDVASMIYFAFPGSFRFKELQTIEGSRKPILFVDTPERHQLFDLKKESLRLYRESIGSFKQGEFQSSLQKMREHIITWADFISKREEVIRENLQEKIKDLIKERPELREKEEIKVLLRLGAAHTGIYHRLKKEEPLTFQQFTSLSKTFLILDEVLRKIMLAKDKRIDKDILAGGIIQEIISGPLERLTDDSNKLIVVGRKICSKLNLKDIKGISKELSENPERTIVDCLESHGIKIPKTEEEMDEMLKIKK